MRKRTREKHLPVGFLLFATIPTAFLMIVFLLIPTVQAVLLSFQEVNVLTYEGTFCGLENFKYLFKDPIFKTSLVNTVKLMAAIPVITLTISFLLAYFLQQANLREKGLYLTFYFYPNFLSTVVVACVWSFVLHPNQGIFNALLRWIGLGHLARGWTGDPATALWTIAVAIIWCCIGYYVVLYTSSLDSISSELYEAATIDGAGNWKKLFGITLPLMKGTIGTTFILLMSGVIGASFVYAQLLTDGGPNGASRVLMQYVYQQGIEGGNTGYSSAITVFTMILGIILAVAARNITTDERS